MPVGGIKETCPLKKMTFAPFVFQVMLSKEDRLALPVFAQQGHWSLPGAFWRWMSGGWPEALEAGRALREVLSSFLSKASSSLLHFVLTRAESMSFHPPCSIQIPKLPLFPAIF